MESPEKRARDGIVSAFIAYFLWGLFPLYFIVVKDVPAFEVLAHRIIWAVPFGALIIHMRRQWPEVSAALRHRRTFLYLVMSAILITGNWLVYIWAVQLEQINQASLGYYINPLLFALAGVVIFGERLRAAQTAAILIAAVGVGVLALSAVQPRQIVEAGSHVGVVGPKGLLNDGQGALVEGLGVAVTALGLVERG